MRFELIDLGGSRSVVAGDALLNLETAGADTTLVIGGDVVIRPCQVAHGNLTLEVATTPVVSQPAPFSEGETVVTGVTDLRVTQDAGYLMPVQGTSASDVAMALNALKVTPRDMISIFQALREAGALDADVEIM